MSDDEKWFTLLRQLQEASKECWAAKLTMHELGTRFAPLCVKILFEGRQIPKLINNRMEMRRQKTGLDPVHPDFWDADMIIALHEYFEDFLAEEAHNASAHGT